MTLPRALALALVACVCFVEAAGAAQTVRLKVAFAPYRAGGRTTIELALHISGPNGTPPEPVTGFDLFLPAGMDIASTTLGQDNCDSANLLDSGLTGCSDNARIGFGDATALVPVGLRSIAERALVDALIGQPGKSVEVLFYAQAAEPVFAQLVLRSAFHAGAAPYGTGLSTSFPLVQAWPEGPDLALSAFNSTIGPLGLTYHEEVHGRTISYKPLGMRIPQRCPASGYPFRAVLDFQDGTNSAVNYRIPCPARQDGE